MKIKRPVVFAIECVLALAIATFGAWAAAKFNGKFNRGNQAGERIAAALERAYPPPKPLPRPSLLDEPILDASCQDREKIRSMAMDAGCALWGRENPCEDGKELTTNGYGVACVDKETK